MQSWTERAKRRGAGMKVFKPPEENRHLVLWHEVQTHLGPKILQWRPGIDLWRNNDGQRWNAEYAGDLGWKYIRTIGPHLGSAA